MEDTPEKKPAREMPSPVAEEFDEWLFEKFRGSWLFEDDADFNERVIDLFETYNKAKEVFAYVHYDPSEVQLRVSKDIFWQADSIFSRSSFDNAGSFIDNARMLCSIPRDFPDAEIYAALAIRRIFWAISWMGDMCTVFQGEVKEYEEPLTLLRAEFPEDYFKEEEKLRIKNWWFERNKIADAIKYQGRAEMLLMLAAISREGVISPMVQSYVASRSREEAIERSAAGGYSRRGKSEPHTAALRGLAESWGVSAAKEFRARIKIEISKLGGGEYLDAASGIAISLASDDPAEIQYRLADGKNGRISAETLRKLFFRWRMDQPKPLSPDSPWAKFR